jgi:hypothetical protein
MYEKLDKLRGDLERAKQRRTEAEQKVKALEEKLREAENNQVIADVTALKLTPEQVAQFLQMAASGQLPMNGAAGNPVQAQSGGYGQNTTNSSKVTADEDTENFDEDDMEDYEDEK